MKKPKLSLQEKKVLIIAVLLLIVAVGYVGLTVFQKIMGEKRAAERVASQQKAYADSLLNNKPEALRELFAADVKSGVNDAFTRSAAFWIMHRYFDNGGNVYEIYDYIASHPELSFLNTEAEAIYPENFKWLHEKTLPNTYATRAKYIMLAYLEVLDQHGYGNVASWGMLAHQYAYEALYSKTIPADFPKGFDHAAFEKNALDKSSHYFDKMKGGVAAIIDRKETSKDLPARDILLAVDEYGASLHYLSTMKVKTAAPKTSDEAFAFASQYSARYVPELLLFTSYLNASTMMADPDSMNKRGLTNALYPWYTFSLPEEQRRPGNIVDRVLNSRTQTYKSIDLYGKTNAVGLAKQVPEFKAWLRANGWAETDFR